MTEAEWLASGDPSRMLHFLTTTGRGTGEAPKQRPVPSGPPSEHAEALRRFHAAAQQMATRKGVLVSCACVRRVPDQFPGIDLAALVESWEAIADSAHIGEETTSPTEDRGFPSAPAAFQPPPRPHVVHAVGHWAAGLVIKKTPVLVGGVWTKERRAQAALLRCLIGNPFHLSPPLPAPVLAWNDRTVRRIAEGIYAERAFDRLPILADALLDAGCEDEELMGHCRSAGVHARGCWAVDLILGKG
jgi:hypothetical protein